VVGDLSMMLPTAEVELAIIGLLTVIAQGIFALLARRDHQETQRQNQETQRQIQVVLESTNGLSIKLAHSARETGYAEGINAGRALAAAGPQVAGPELAAMTGTPESQSGLV
jgi:hypothetical protein